MKEIIQKGRLPEERHYRVECLKCKTVFRYQREDIRTDQRDGDYVKCPLCKAFINHNGAYIEDITQ